MKIARLAISGVSLCISISLLTLSIIDMLQNKEY